MFTDVASRVGLPDVVRHYDVEGPGAEPDDTASIFPDDAAPIPLFRDDSNFDPAESRIHRRIVFITIGKPLNRADGPRQLVLGILHAMLGMPQLL
jgi:hypothetical protein